MSPLAVQCPACGASLGAPCDADGTTCEARTARADALASSHTLDRMLDLWRSMSGAALDAEQRRAAADGEAAEPWMPATKGRA